MSSPADNVAYATKMMLWPLLVELEFIHGCQTIADMPHEYKKVAFDKIFKAVSYGWFRIGYIGEPLPEHIYGINPNTGHYEFLWNIT